MTDNSSLLSMTVSITKPMSDIWLTVSINSIAKQTIKFELLAYQICMKIDQSMHKQVLGIQLGGKHNRHVVLDQGRIVSDVQIYIKDVCFDGVCIDELLPDVASYTHHHNGNGPTVTQPFYGIMGCNGLVSLPFETPLYLWLMHNM